MRVQLPSSPSPEGERREPWTRIDDTDLIAVEEPIELRLRYRWRGMDQTRTVSVTMRTPGQDEFLALGFLYGESIISSADDVQWIVPCDGDGRALTVALRDTVSPGAALNDRNFMMTSSCGVCGKASVEQVWRTVPSTTVNVPTLSINLISTFAERAAQQQSLFKVTGGNHGAALFRDDGTLVCAHEDVGRHNAVDKVVGELLTRRSTTSGPLVLFLSGRISFELMQKAARAGIGAVLAVGAPSSLAIDIAARFDMLLVGFLKDHTFNIYHGAHHVFDAS